MEHSQHPSEGETEHWSTGVEEILLAIDSLSNCLSLCRCWQDRHVMMILRHA